MTVRKVLAEELHKPARRKFPRRSVTLKGLNDLYQSDLVEMGPYAKENKGMRYILTMINCFTKYAFAVPLKSKSAIDVARALEPILKKHKMKHLQTDQGKEYFNKTISALMKKYNINLYSTFSDLKASIIERFNRTLKERMWKAFTERGSYEWVSLLPNLIKQYNNSVHSTIKMRPKDVKQIHVKDILTRLRKRDNKRKVTQKPKFGVNDRVRISKFKKVFTKGYIPNWTNEVFKIRAVKPTKPVTYILEDLKGEVLKGGFYQEELSKSSVGDVYLIEKVLKRRGDKVQVRWLNFDRKADSWIKASDIVK